MYSSAQCLYYIPTPEYTGTIKTWKLLRVSYLMHTSEIWVLRALCMPLSAFSRHLLAVDSHRHIEKQSSWWQTFSVQLGNSVLCTCHLQLSRRWLSVFWWFNLYKNHSRWYSDSKEDGHYQTVSRRFDRCAWFRSTKYWDAGECALRRSQIRLRYSWGRTRRKREELRL